MVRVGTYGETFNGYFLSDSCVLSGSTPVARTSGSS